MNIVFLGALRIPTDWINTILIAQVLKYGVLSNKFTENYVPVD